jgi:TM2 domain-containing membrane protein YozV
MAEKSKVVYGVLAIILGWLGIHKFYVGDTKNGLIYLLITVCSLGMLYWIPAILGLVGGIIALTKDDKEFNQKYVIDKSFI